MANDRNESNFVATLGGMRIIFTEGRKKNPLLYQGVLFT